VTLTARREPTFDGVAGNSRHGSSHGEGHEHGTVSASKPVTGHAGDRPTGFFRLVSTAQVVATLLAVPLGLGSGYSIYRSNFSPETTCQALRSTIIGMLDKNVDATTRRMLVRRDIEAFERNCGGVDPDAHAAFRHLLSVDLPVAVPLPKAEPKSETKPGSKIAKVELKGPIKPDAKAEKAQAKGEAKAERKVEIQAEPKLESKSEAKSGAKPETKSETKPETNAEVIAEVKPESLQRDAALSDTRWLAAVRQALVKHGPVTEEPKPALFQPSWDVTPARVTPVSAPPVSAARAPELPPAQTVSPTVSQTPVQSADHPVPPASIPIEQPMEFSATSPAPPQVRQDERSRLGELIADIPVVGRMIRRGE